MVLSQHGSKVANPSNLYQIVLNVTAQEQSRKPERNDLQLHFVKVKQLKTLRL